MDYACGGGSVYHSRRRGHNQTLGGRYHPHQWGHTRAARRRTENTRHSLPPQTVAVFYQWREMPAPAIL